MKFLISDKYKNQSGIYKITNTINRKFYIGSTEDFYTRFKGHVTDFNKKTQNPHFQNAWNKYGPNVWEMTLLELCSEEKLTEREQWYLDKWEMTKTGYNVSPSAQSSRGTRRTAKQKKKHSNLWISISGKNFTIIDPKGERHEGIGLIRFCREKQISSTAICAVVRGESTHHKGWHLPNTDISKINIRAERPKKYYFIDINQKKHEINHGELNLFCEKNGLTSSCLSMVWSGKRISHKGWIKG